MDVVLIILGVLGFGAIVIAAYVFTVAARNYVSDEEEAFHPERQQPPQANKQVARQAIDRRRGTPVSFPLIINDVKIPRDRRTSPDRRLNAA